MSSAPKVKTVLLGQFEHARADALAKELTEAGIVWWHKQSGGIARTFFRGDWGVRLFVDSARAEEVRQILERVNARFQVAVKPDEGS